MSVKPACRLADDRVVQRLAWPSHLITGRGWTYEVWTGCDPVVLENIGFLAGYRRTMVVPIETARTAAESVVDGEQLSGAERRLSGGGPAYLSRPAVLAALWHGLRFTSKAAGHGAGRR